YREFVRTTVMPLEPRMASERWSALEPALREARSKAKSLGLWAPFLPRDLGGRELPLEALALVSAEVGGRPLGHERVTGHAPEANLLGGRGAGFALAQERLGPGRIHHCMRWIGICERAIEMLCRYAGTREIAPGRTLATRQTVQEWIADSRAEVDAARLMVLYAAW